MAGEADPWWDGMRQEAELPPPEAAPSRLPAVLGAVAALAVSGAMGWWFSRPDAGFKNPETAQVHTQAAVVRTAAPSADAEQVRRAYDEFSSVYATSGLDGLARFSDSCRQSLAGDPRILDFCLAFDLFAEAVSAGEDAAAPLALARSALPADADAQQRVAQVRTLMRQITGVPEVEKTVQQPAETRPRENVRKASAPAPVLTTPPRIARIAAPVARRADRTTIPATCRSKSTPADRLICAYPSLAVQHWAMRQAYEHALAAGADPLAVDEGQAEWRVARNAAGDRKALAALYARRIRELNAAAANPKAEPARDEPPT